MRIHVYVSSRMGLERQKRKVAIVLQPLAGDRESCVLMSLHEPPLSALLLPALSRSVPRSAAIGLAPRPPHTYPAAGSCPAFPRSTSTPTKAMELAPHSSSTIMAWAFSNIASRFSPRHYSRARDVVI